MKTVVKRHTSSLYYLDILFLTELFFVFQANMAASQKFCLKWNNFQNSVTSVFDNLRQDEELVDITLCCEGKKIKAHRMMLSACSPYFRELFKVRLS